MKAKLLLEYFCDEYDLRTVCKHPHTMGNETVAANGFIALIEPGKKGWPHVPDYFLDKFYDITHAHENKVFRPIDNFEVSSRPLFTIPAVFIEGYAVQLPYFNLIKNAPGLKIAFSDKALLFKSGNQRGMIMLLQGCQK